MKVLIIAPHMDDEVLGCGGTIARHVQAKDDVFVFFIAHRVYNHGLDKKKNDLQKQHALKAKEILCYKENMFLDLNDERLDSSIQDIIIPLEKYVLEIKPDTVYCPFYMDNNQDHRAVFNAARVVLRPVAAPFIKNIYMYEIPSSTDQSPALPEYTFLPNTYINISGYMDKKIEAFKCYETELREYPHPRSIEALEVLAKKRGTEIGFKYAESFMVLRKRYD